MVDFPFLPLEVTDENVIMVFVFLIIVSILGIIANYLYKKGKLIKILYTDIGKLFNIKKKRS